MRYENMKQISKKCFKFPKFSGGVCSRNKPNQINNNQLLEGKNLVYSCNALEGRKGLNCSLDGILDISEYNGAESVEYNFTNTEILIDEIIYKIATANIKYDNSHRFICLFGISKNCSVKKLGFLHFGRVDDSTFYVPENITVFSGRAWQGSGIFALVTTYNFENPQNKEYQIYEAPKEYGEWSICLGEYVPTVYINGRGNAYETSKAANLASTAVPRILESPNLLNGEFYAYFSSDGYSSGFKLPYANIANDTVSCRLYISPEKYVQWIIKRNSTSAEATIDNKTITMTVERSKGMVYFKSDNTDFSIPKMNLYPENNIRFFALLDSSDKFNEVVSCTVSAQHGSLTVFSGGINNSKLYYARQDNPLYFSEFTDSAIGDSDSKVMAFMSVADKLYAFKENSIFTVKPNHPKAINSNSLLGDNDRIFFEPYEFTIECVNDRFGCTGAEKITQFKKSPIWYHNNKIYTLNSSNKTVNLLSENINDYICENFNNQAYVTQSDGLFMLTNNNKAVIMCFETKESKLSDENVLFFIWEFPKVVEICGAITLEDRLILLCKNTENKICFAAFLDNCGDRFPIKRSNVIKISEQDIEILFKTKYYNLGELNEKYLIKNGIICASASKYIEFLFESELANAHYLYKNGYDFTKIKKPLELEINLLPSNYLGLTVKAVGSFIYLDAQFNCIKLDI